MKTKIEILIERLKEAKSKENNMDVKTGINLALLVAYDLHSEEIMESFKQIKSN